MNKLQLLSLTGIAFSAMAQTPVFSLVPIGALPTTIDSGATEAVAYTVTNNTPYTLQNSGVRYAPQGKTPVGVTQTAGGCGDPFTLAGGASCTLNLLITANNLVNGQAVGGPEVCNTKLNSVHCSVPAAADQLNVSVVPPPPPPPIPSLAVGQDLTGTMPPFFVQSYDQGSSWENGVLPSGSPTDGLFRSSSCNDTICVAVGQNSATAASYLIYTTNHGISWNMLSPIASATLYSTSCVTDFCVAVGSGPTTSLLLQTLNQGATWTQVPQSDTGGVYYTSSCSESICVAAGQSPAPRLVYSASPLGGSWTVVLGLPAEGSFNSTSCSGSLCLAVGVLDSSSDALIRRTLNAGSTWDDVLGLTQTERKFRSVSCFGAVCVVGGDNFVSANISILSVTTNSGDNWSDVSTASLPVPSGSFRAISCTADICVAGGSTATTSFMVQSTDGGVTWSDVNVGLFLPADAQILALNCDAEFCIVGGTGFISGAPFLAQTQNAGANWTAVTGVTLPATGVFNGATASPLLSDFKDEIFYFKTPLLRILSQ